MSLAQVTYPVLLTVSFPPLVSELQFQFAPESARLVVSCKPPANVEVAVEVETIAVTVVVPKEAVPETPSWN